MCVWSWIHFPIANLWSFSLSRYFLKCGLGVSQQLRGRQSWICTGWWFVTSEISKYQMYHMDNVCNFGNIGYLIGTISTNIIRFYIVSDLKISQNLRWYSKYIAISANIWNLNISLILWYLCLIFTWKPLPSSCMHNPVLMTCYSRLLWQSRSIHVCGTDIIPPRKETPRFCLVSAPCSRPREHTSKILLYLKLQDSLAISYFSRYIFSNLLIITDYMFIGNLPKQSQINQVC